MTASRFPVAPADKIIAPDAIADVCAGYRQQGDVTVFTNGCFDILHVGHLRYLFEAARHGDRLIIGVNSDASVRRLKGDKRPIVSEAQRMEMLCGFYFVAHAVVFDEDTPEALIRRIRPDVLLKGGDWPVSEIVGNEFVHSYGGKVHSLSFVDGKSTSGVISTILQRYPSPAHE